jgi:hypothetical protein
METIIAQFKGYETTATNSKGETYPVRVINRRESATRKDGTIGTLLKIQEIYYRQNPSPYADRNIKCYTSPIWVRAESING